MALLYLVRHGRAAAAWDVDPDPGLDELGHRQAQEMAQVLAAEGPMQLVTSPMARTRETALPLAQNWQRQPRIEPRISEIPSPGLAVSERGAWLQEIAVQQWPELGEPLRLWRQDLLSALLEAEQDTVFVTHFMVINAALAAVTADSRVVSFRPDYCSVTVLRSENGQLHLVRRGAEGSTRVL